MWNMLRRRVINAQGMNTLQSSGLYLRSKKISPLLNLNTYSTFAYRAFKNSKKCPCDDNVESCSAGAPILALFGP